VDIVVAKVLFTLHQPGATEKKLPKLSNLQTLPVAYLEAQGYRISEDPAGEGVRHSLPVQV